METFFIGDTFSAPAPMSSRVRLRVREIEQHPHWPQPVYHLQLYTVISCPDEFGWLDRSHDRCFTAKQIREYGLELVEKAARQLDLFGGVQA